MTELTSAEVQAASSIVLSWDWQIAEGHNYSFEHGLHTLTRFYESAPMESDQFSLIIKFLRTQEDVELINVNHKGISLDGTWRAKDAWYQTANGDKFEGSETNRVRIYQTLVGKDDDVDADGPYLIENGCKYKVSHTFFWDVDDLPSLETGDYVSSSGVQFSMLGVTRDRETGLFSCVIERKETVQQDIPYYDSVETIFETREDSVHLGVKQQSVESTGDEASAAGGVLVERHLSKNPDCTTDVSNVRTTEQNVKSSLKAYRKTLRGTVVTTTDRNESAALGSTNMKVGEQRQSEKTPGGLFNNTTSKVTTEAAGEIATECQKTIFEHQHSETNNVLTEPSDKEVAAATNGVIKRQIARETEEGTWDVVDETRTEIGVASAVKRYRKTLRGLVETTTDRNQAAALDATNITVGEQRESEKTPGGLFNNTTSKVTTGAAGEIGIECQKTIFEHQHAETNNVLTEPSDKEVAEASNGVIKRQIARETEEGTWDVVDETRTEKSVTSAVKGYRKTLRGLIETTTDRNQANPTNSTNIAVGEQRQSEKTPGGLYNNTTIKTTTVAAGTIAESCEIQDLVHTDSKIENELTKPTVEQIVATNVVKSKTARKTEEGSWDVTTTTQTYTPSSKVETWNDDNYSYIYLEYVNAVTPKVPSAGAVITDTTNHSETIPEGATITCQYTHNQHGTFNGTVHVRFLRNQGTRIQTLYWEKTNTGKKGRYYYFNRKGKFCYREFTCTHYECYGPYRTVADKCKDGDDLPCLGWFTKTRNASVDTAFGDKYTNIQVGSEQLVDSAA